MTIYKSRPVITNNTISTAGHVCAARGCRYSDDRCVETTSSRRRPWTACLLPLMAMDHAKSWPKDHIIFTKLISWTCSTTIFEHPTRTVIILKFTWIPTSYDHKHSQNILLKSYAALIRTRKIGWNYGIYTTHHLDCSNNCFAWSLAFGIASNNY